MVSPCVRLYARVLWPISSFLRPVGSLPHRKDDMDAHLIGIDLAELLLKKRGEKERPAKASAPDSNSIATEEDRAECRGT
jgi:hypothetical protein